MTEESKHLLNKICMSVLNGEIPNRGVEIDGVNYSSYMGYLCKWVGIYPQTVCSMNEFYKYYKENVNI